MSDLVKRLRSGADYEHDTVVMEEAAARIERLEAALAVFRSCGCPVCGGDCASANPPILNCPMRTEDGALQETQQ